MIPFSPYSTESRNDKDGIYNKISMYGTNTMKEQLKNVYIIFIYLYLQIKSEEEYQDLYHKYVDETVKACLRQIIKDNMSNYVNIEIFEQIKQKFFEYIKQDENEYWNISKFPLQLSYRLLLRYLIV